MTEQRDLSTADIAGREAAEPTREMVREDMARGEAAGEREPLFDERQISEFRDRWHEVQTRFVDEPRQVVETADKLVAELMQALADSFARERANLESQWDRGEDVSTEELRVALQRYRSFFDRLLSA